MAKGNMVELAFKKYEKLKTKESIFENKVCSECGNDDIYNIDNDWHCDKCGNVW